MTPEAIAHAAELLLSARVSGTPLVGLPAELHPADAEEAYRIQDQVTDKLGPIGGWKTAPAKAGVKFSWAPIPATGCFGDGAVVPLSIFAGGALELEIGFTVATSLPPRETPYSRGEVEAALGEMCVCIELFGSRYADRAARSAMEILADAQNAVGVVVGEGRSDWGDLDLGRTELALDYAGQTHRAAGGRLLDELLEACTDLANGSTRLGGLVAGQVIITGARVGPIPAAHSGPAAGRIDPVGTVSVTLT